jgi:hypothetical protein
LLGAVAVVLLGPPFVVAAGNDGDAPLRLRLVGLLLAVLVALVWDDPAGQVVAATPVGLPAVHRIRLLVLLVPVTAGWALACVAASTQQPETLVWSATVEISGVAVLLTAVVGMLSRDRLGESIAAYPVPVLVVGLALMTRLPGRWTLLAAPGSSAWTDAHRRWMVLLVVGLFALAVAARDPAGRALLRTRPRRSP